MSLADYAGWNEDAQYMWWQEEGRHAAEYEPSDDDLVDWREAADYDNEGEDE